jgi:hypothetical protein
MGQLIQKAIKAKWVGAFGAVAGGVLSDQCKPFIQKISQNEPATINLQTRDGQSLSQTINFSDLVQNNYSSAPAPVYPGSFLDPQELRAEECDGYQYQAFFDLCMSGEIDPLYN